MDVLVKLPKSDNMKDIDKLRKIYNSLETSERNLADLRLEITLYAVFWDIFEWGIYVNSSTSGFFNVKEP